MTRNRHRALWGLVAALVGGLLEPAARSAELKPVEQAAGPATYGYRVVHSFPHDAGAFTQGLVYRGGFFFESTGLNGRSSLRKVAIETGQVVQQQPVDSKYFAEGLADWHDHLIQLTWRTQIGFVYDLTSFKMVRSFAYPGEGWGLTHDGTRLILSDGSSTLRFLNPETMAESGRVTVTDRGKPIDNLNELEFVKGEVFANIWQTDRIARISPASGQVTGWIYLQGLLPSTYRLESGAVLNGIVYDAAGDWLFVTGKLWPKVFEIALERRPEPPVMWHR